MDQPSTSTSLYDEMTNPHNICIPVLWAACCLQMQPGVLIASITQHSSYHLCMHLFHMRDEFVQYCFRPPLCVHIMQCTTCTHIPSSHCPRCIHPPCTQPQRIHPQDMHPHAPPPAWSMYAGPYQRVLKDLLEVGDVVAVQIDPMIRIACLLVAVIPAAARHEHIVTHTDLHEQLYNRNAKADVGTRTSCSQNWQRCTCT